MTYKYVQTKTTLLRITIEESRLANNNFLTCRTSLAKLRAVKNSDVSDFHGFYSRKNAILNSDFKFKNLTQKYCYLELEFSAFVVTVHVAIGLPVQSDDHLVRYATIRSIVVSV